MCYSLQLLQSVSQHTLLKSGRHAAVQAVLHVWQLGEALWCLKRKQLRRQAKVQGCLIGYRHEHYHDALLQLADLLV